MVDLLSYFLFQSVLHNWYNKGCGMYYHVCGIGHIKEPYLERVAHVVVAADFLSRYMSGPLPYVQCDITVLKCIECVIK